MDRYRLLVPMAAIAVLAGCGGAPAAAPAEPATSSTTGSATTPAGGGPRLVVLGDSYPARGESCDWTCTQYADLYAAALGEELGQEVPVTDLSSSQDYTSSTVLQQLTGDEAARAAVAAASAVVITVGFNDWQGPCTWAGHAECLEAGLETVRQNLTAVLAAISDLREGRPTAVRVTTYPNIYLGKTDADQDWGYPPAQEAAFQRVFSEALKDFGRMLCMVSTHAGAACVDLVPVFNGPAGDRDAGKLLAADHVHPSAEGHRAIGEALVASGFAPLVG
jgi:lysophospholipase L1-like esterase